MAGLGSASKVVKLDYLSVFSFEYFAYALEMLCRAYWYEDGGAN